MAATIKELKDMIVDLRMDLVDANIPSSHCTYACYNRENLIKDCNSIGYGECRRIFMDNMRKDIEKVVMAL